MNPAGAASNGENRKKPALSVVSAFNMDCVNRSLMTAPEVADLLGVPASWVYEQSRRGRIPTVTLGHYRRYRREAIVAWVEELEAGATHGKTGRGGIESRRLVAR